MISLVLNLLGWYLLLAALGWLAFPIAYRFLRALPDRGYAFSRPLGLLLWGFVFWILSSFGVLPNERGGLLTALLIVALFSIWAWFQAPRGELLAWLRSKRSTVISVEIVFAIAFLFMAYIRATGPAVYHTEQPMELAIINAILHSPAMPPHDPWLSGFSISYYYFGYLLVALQAKLLGIAGSVAFNLGFISTFAMAATGAYGLVYNLLALYKPRLSKSLHWLAGLAPLLVLLMGNAEGLLEIVHAEHIFWRTDASGAQTSSFWAWMDIKDLVNPPSDPPHIEPRLYGTGSWWWWRASRVINDRTYAGGEQELIDEIPAFSYVLGDLHPHVLSMPFVFLAMGLGLNLYLGGAERKKPLPLLGLEIRESDLAVSILIVGALAFLNIWDFPIYIILLAGAYVLRRAQLAGWRWHLIEEFLALAFTFGLGGLLLYLPFYLSFTSQAGGILPNLLNPTRGAQFWVMFVTLLVPIVIYLIFLWTKSRQPSRLLKSLVFGFALVAALWAFSLGVAWLYSVLLGNSNLGQAVLSGMGGPDFSSLISESINRRLSAAGGWISISLLLGLLFGLVFKSESRAKKEGNSTFQSQSFVLLLALVAALLVTAPEFIYLRDQFGTRMNTVFKFYIEAWLMWGVVAAYATVVLLSELRGIARGLFAGLMALTLMAGLVYPAFAFSDNSRRNGQPLSLDGGQGLPPDASDAIAWLQKAPLGVLVEAVGGSYTAFARYATFSGQPGVMGWPGHESQWRNGNVDYGRISDIETLYTTQDWGQTLGILEKYDVRYVVVGDLERGAYTVDETKFQQNLLIGFQSGQVNIYLVP
jgi:YYY domain-containing protein